MVSDDLMGDTPGEETPTSPGIEGNETMMAILSNLTELIRLQTTRAETQRVEREERPIPVKVDRPATFSGDRYKDDTDLESFLAQCENCFRMDPRGFKEDGAKVGLAVGSLRGRASQLVTALMSNESRRNEVADTWEHFKNYLQQSFGDPDRKNRACRELYKLTQTGSAVQYFVEIERLMAVAGWVSKEAQEILVGQAESGLKPHLRRILAEGGHKFSTIKDLAAHVIQMDERIHALDIEERTRYSKTRNPDSGPRPVTFSSNFGARPELSANRTPVHPSYPDRYIDGTWRQLTTAEFIQRKEKKLCFTCGSAAHSSTTCDKVNPKSQTFAGPPRVKVEFQEPGKA